MPTGTDTGPVPVDTLVAGTVVTMDGDSRVISDGAVVVDHGRILAVGKRSELTDSFRPARTLGGGDAIVLPGFIDCHTHSTQSLLRGLIAGELPMIYRLYVPADMELSLDEAYVATKLCAAQLVRSGVTTVCDFQTNVPPEYEYAVLAAMGEVGVRCNLLRSHGDQESHHAALYSQIRDRSWRRERIGEAEHDLRRTEEMIAEYATDGMVEIGVCPSNLLSFSDDYFRLAHDLVERTGARMHVHAARDREEVEFCLSLFGRRPIERLDDLGVIDRNLVVVHGMMATASEIKLLGDGHASLAHSAVECANILNRVPDIPAMRTAGVTVGLGCDNAVNDMFIVMHSAWLLHTVTRGIDSYDPGVMDEVDVFGMATSEAARALGLDGRVGSLEVGKAADLSVLDGGAAHLGPVQDLVPELVRFGSRAEVTTVMVDGKVVVEDGQHTAIDLEALRAAAAPIAERLDGLIAPRRYQAPSGRRRFLCC
ncbi:MAG: amidohydrolase family protein [Bauldia sp.]|nr:amidohydrolase family protein [Bauldia sp.]